MLNNSATSETRRKHSPFTVGTEWTNGGRGLEAKARIEPDSPLPDAPRRTLSLIRHVIRLLTKLMLGFRAVFCRNADPLIWE